MNKTTKTIVSYLGLMLALGGLDHGIFETLQGFTPTPGLVIQAIGPVERFWVHGSEEAFTIIPNFLVTGILAILVGLAILIWSFRFMHMKRSGLVFILLCVLLFLVGGGIGQIVFFIPAFMAATRVHSPLTGWQKILPAGIRPGFSRIWPFTLGISIISYLIALEIAIFGWVPGLSDAEQILQICWSLLVVSLLCNLVSVISGFAKDIILVKAE